mmetsp:Transcript_50027/g.81070  ORF Transcript_50027/g.81070 Transcript_50027/m.81070 type:complete len:348 (+) Transcript_50027:292-1335(+)
MGLCVHVGNDWNARPFQIHSSQDLSQLGHGRRHEVRVECPGHCERNGHFGLEVGLCNLDQLGTGHFVTRDSVVAVAQVVGDADLLAAQLRGLGAERLRRGGVQADNTHHARLDGIGCSLHGFTTRLRDAHAVLKAQSAGEAQSAVLSQRQAHGHGGGIDGRSAAFLAAKLLDCSHGGHKDGGLRDGGGVEDLFGSVHAAVQEVVAENFARLLKHLLGFWHLSGQVLAHADGLRSLAWEEEGQLVGVARKLAVASTPGCDRCSRHGKAQRGTCKQSTSSAILRGPLLCERATSQPCRCSSDRCPPLRRLCRWAPSDAHETFGKAVGGECREARGKSERQSFASAGHFL